MYYIYLADGAKREFPKPLSGYELAASISTSLAKKALAIKIDGSLCDLNTQIPHQSKVELILPDSQDGLEILRHDSAHIAAQALKELYPDIKLAIGPVIENGFYYDFDSEHHVTEHDLVKIEKKMQEIVSRNLEIIRFRKSKSEAIELFKKQSEPYKVEIFSELSDNEEITFYQQGDFLDPCRGPHSPTTGRVKAFKLLKVAGAYWRGDSNNKMLQRIYGTAWASKKDLEDYLHRLEEAEKRDHRKLGKQLDLFHFQDIAPGTVFWHPKGWKIFQIVLNFMRNVQDLEGYLEISTPEVMDKQIWVKTGHADKFDVNMYSATVSDESKEFTIRPMNCPGGVQVFNQGIKSYRDLPLRLSEFGKVYRYEPSGALHGLFRARGFTQDDAHIFCTEDQITEESRKVCELVKKVYSAFGFKKVKVKFADRPEKRIGSDEIWDIAEKSLKDATIKSGLEFSINPGEGAFYGPKLEFVLKDAIGRDWQLGTLQLDLNLPERLDISYVDANGDQKRPVMLHRAILGSFERFIAILIENYAGNLPLWIAPTQVVIAPISNKFDSYALETYNKLKSLGARVEIDLENEKISYKIRKHSTLKTPIIVVVGQKEMEEKSVTIRRLGSDMQESLEFSTFSDRLLKEMNAPTYYT